MTGRELASVISELADSYDLSASRFERESIQGGLPSIAPLIGAAAHRMTNALLNELAQRLRKIET